MFREAYRKRRCIVPVEGFFEWQATKGGKQPYAIAMKNGAAFGLAGLWENWKDPARGDWGPDIHNRHRAVQRADRADSRPHAGDPAACRL
jgi:putative SOS response-associated peptidase YedK